MRKLVLCLLLSIVSCGSKTGKEFFLEVLISNRAQTKIWNYYVLESQNDTMYLGYKYKFEKDNYEIYTGDINEVKPNLSNFCGNANLDSSWNYNEETNTLSFGLDSFIIERYTTDTIFMSGNGFEGEFMMVKMKDL